MSTLTFAMSPYLASSLLNHVLRNTSLTSGSGWLGLYLSNPYLSTNNAEVSGSSSGYSRLKVPFTISGSVALNTSIINFPKATGNWGAITYFGISDASATGNLLFYGELPIAKTVYTNNIFFVNSGELNINLEGGFSVYLANALLNHVLNDIAYTSPGLDVFTALYSTLPDKNDSGGTEISATDYSRLRISGSTWTTPAMHAVYYNYGGTGDADESSITNLFYVSNKTSLTFCTDTQYSWGTITGLCLRDAPTGGNQLFRGSFNYPSTIIIGDSYKIQINDLIVENG